MRLSDGSLVEDWTRPAAPLLIPVVIEDPPDPAELLADRIVLAVSELKAALQALPTPQINIAAPDLADVVSAVTAAGPTASAEEVADAVAARLHIPAPESNAPLVDAITAAFEKMDHRLVGLGKPAFGASGPSNISDNAARQLGHVTVDNFPSSVQVIDAAETASLLMAPFTITAAGTATLVAAPGGASLLRLRRLSSTYAIRCTVNEPILSLFVGAVEVQRGNALSGRFDITAAASSDAITLTTDVLDVGGRVTGTVYYEVVT